MHSIPSFDGAFIATLLPSQLVLQSATTLDPLRTISLDPDYVSRVRCLRWSPPSSGALDNRSRRSWLAPEEQPSVPQRLLLADDDSVRVWDIYATNWHGVIDGAGGGLGKIAHVDFGCDADEVLVFSDFAVKLTIWSLTTGRSIDIRDPKFSSRGFGYRPRTGELALLTRPAACDVVTLHARTTYKVLGSFKPSTSDAQGLAWSPDGRWITIWDAPSTGLRVLIYTADGHLFRTYCGSADDGSGGLGVRSLEWSHAGDFLAVGDHDKRVILLNGITFSPIAYLVHPTTVDLPKVPVWAEQMPSGATRLFTRAVLPLSLPTSVHVAADPNAKIGISSIAFCSADGAMVATRSDHFPTTVWIWSTRQMLPLAILVHRSPVKSIEWHLSTTNLLMLCVNPEPLVYLWNSTWTAPRIIEVPLPKSHSRQDARWIRTEAISSATWQQERPKLMFRNGENFVVGSLDAGEWEDQLGDGEDRQGSSHSPHVEDGRGILNSPDSASDGRHGIWEAGGKIEDTFRFRTQVGG